MKHKKITHIGIIALLFFSFGLIACDSGPEKINYGSDNCAECNMGIMDRNYGSELITGKGKVYKFDSIECLASFIIKKEAKSVKSIWVANFRNPDEFIEAEKAIYIKNDKIHSPMGLNVLALNSQKDKSDIINAYGGEVLEWKDILSLVEKKGN